MAKNERFAQKTDDLIPNPAHTWDPAEISEATMDLSMWLMINCHPYLGPSKDHWCHDWSLGGRGPTRHHTGDAGEGDPFAQTHHHPAMMINPILHIVPSYWRYKGKVAPLHRPITTLQWWITLYYTVSHHTGDAGEVNPSQRPIATLQGWLTQYYTALSLSPFLPLLSS